MAKNGVAERLIGSLRRECLDQMLIFGEEHLRRVLAAYAGYYNQTRPYLALQKDAPLRRSIQRIGKRSLHPCPRWTTSPIRSDLIFGRDT
jgi:transposase InsO family protein